MAENESLFQGTSRWRRMSMDTLHAADDVRRDGRAKSAPYVSGKYNRAGSLTTEGIPLSTPAPLYKYLNRGPSASPTLTKNWPELKNRPRKPLRNRPNDCLYIDDIEGCRPDPKNMKLGNKARGTSPLVPEYKLPSFVEPSPYEPKFLKDSMNVNDIDGSRPSSRISSRVTFFLCQCRVFLMVQERDHMTVTDIEGSTAGWKPTHRRNFGKYTRDLCLQVHDISPPKCRYVRDPCSEVYEPVEGAHPQPRSRPRSPWSPVDSSLRTADIEGTEADSMLLKSKVKMRKKKSASRNMVTTQQEKAELVAVKLLKTRVLDQMKGKSCKEVVRAFKNKDRQASGKLTIDEVENVFRALDVGLNSAELRVFSTAFDSSIDGYLNYWQLIKHLVPVVPSKIKTPGATRVVPMALQGWSQTVEPQPCFFQKSRDETCATEKAHEISSQTGRLREAPKAVDKSTVEAETEKEEDKRDAALPWRRTHSMDLSRQRRQSVQLRGRQTSSPLPIGGAFWPEVKLIGSPVPPKSYLSLFHDHHEPHNISGYYRVLDDSERRWSTRVGENLYTGEANVVCSTSYSEGTQWTRPPSSQRRSSSRCSTPLVDTTRPSMAMSGRTSRPSTALSATRPSTAMSVYFDDDDNVSSRAAHYTDENSGYHQSRGGDVARKLKRPQSASTVLLRGGTPECLRTISNMNSVGLRPYTSHSAVRSRSPSNRLTMPHGVQRQLSQMMDDIAAVKALV
ncbi:uncharacterized protein LOC9630602 isoform X1 [Selaginella moellendorffii]|uniref:uncharacterized protein LOC9630602 isoform X1 n=1 Tax=Selaginella moellendorffii TaxID=88036 RepID=UPI000D1C66D3|nr:uncharacterized protein LOC9630602 isoform X1 [Selaginella moellendorffii]|eukprot:XP_024536500.1 uncharacterized protein LOC9630602 isoform X1 [Selaginella moellendorffii]